MRCEMKCVAVHDRATCKPMMVFKVLPENERERRIMSRAGFGVSPDKQHAYTFFYDVSRDECTWSADRLTDDLTCGTAAMSIGSNAVDFRKLKAGGLIDCEYLRGKHNVSMSFDDEFGAVKASDWLEQ